MKRTSQQTKNWSPSRSSVTPTQPVGHGRRPNGSRALLDSAARASTGQSTASTEKALSNETSPEPTSNTGSASSKVSSSPAPTGAQTPCGIPLKIGTKICASVRKTFSHRDETVSHRDEKSVTALKTENQDLRAHTPRAVPCGNGTKKPDGLSARSSSSNKSTREVSRVRIPPLAEMLDSIRSSPSSSESRAFAKLVSDVRELAARKAIPNG